MPDAPRRSGGRRRGAAPTPAPAEGGAAGATAHPDQGAPKQGTPRVLSDGRVQMLVYLPQELVRAVKHAAVDQGTSASHVVEQALAHWLA